MLGFITPGELIPGLTAVALIVGAVAVGWVTWRSRSQETWRKNYERQKTTCIDLTAENERLKADLKDAEREGERFRQRYFKTLADKEWYEKRYGEIPSGENPTGGR